MINRQKRSSKKLTKLMRCSAMQRREKNITSSVRTGNNISSKAEEQKILTGRNGPTDQEASVELMPARRYSGTKISSQIFSRIFLEEANFRGEPASQDQEKG